MLKWLQHHPGATGEGPAESPHRRRAAALRLHPPPPSPLPPQEPPGPREETRWGHPLEGAGEWSALQGGMCAPPPPGAAAQGPPPPPFPPPSEAKAAQPVPMPRGHAPDQDRRRREPAVGLRARRAPLVRRGPRPVPPTAQQPLFEKETPRRGPHAHRALPLPPKSWSLPEPPGARVAPEERPPRQGQQRRRPGAGRGVGFRHHLSLPPHSPPPPQTAAPRGARRRCRTFPGRLASLLQGGEGPAAREGRPGEPEALLPTRGFPPRFRGAPQRKPQECPR